MPDCNLLFHTMKTGGEVIFDPSCEETFISDVEVLLGGVPVAIYPDGTEQFLDESAEPTLVYSPRLPQDQLEEFCRVNIAAYEAFNQEHGDMKLQSERVPMTPFWPR